MKARNKEFRAFTFRCNLFTTVHSDFPSLFTHQMYRVNMMSYVLFIGLNEPLQVSLSEVFNESGYEVVSESDPSEGTTLAMNRPPHLIILAEDTPDIEGEVVLQALRRLTDTPIIVVGSGRETSVVKALLDGADIYMSRPINHRELLSRARSLLRRSVSK